MGVIREGDYVVLKKEKNTKVFRLCKQRNVFMDKVKFKLDGAIGHPYGTMFEVKNGNLFKLHRADLSEEANQKVAGVDNRDLHDLDTNQMLSQEEIEEMKKSGESRERIIEHIVENSVTFEKKTEYAQAKYIKKKKLKHLMEFRILKPNARHLCEMYFAKAPFKICNMRSDSLSQVLAYGNVRSGINVGISESCQGLVIGAVLERLGGTGNVVTFHPGNESPRPILEMFGFSSEFMKTVHSFPLHQVNPLRAELSGDGSGQANTADGTMVCKDTSIDEEPEPMGNKNNSDNEAHNPETELVKRSDDEDLVREHKKRKRKGKNISEAENVEKTRKFLLKNKLDCLVVATKYHPTPIVMALVDFLAPSRPLVVYSQFKEPLMDCYTQVRERGGFINFHLTETWLRQYQVLPQRTHPVIQMCGASGYLMTACCVSS